jgi:copper chaperone NosL
MSEDVRGRSARHAQSLRSGEGNDAIAARSGSSRRRFLVQLGVAGFSLSPVAAALISACAREPLPNGLVEIRWDRDVCTRCKMVISDRRFAVEVRGGPKPETYKFDDIGCAAAWLKDRPWGEEAATRIWVADYAASGQTATWLDARTARFITGKTSPMAYNFAAVATPRAGSIDFAEVKRQAVERDCKGMA